MNSKSATRDTDPKKRYGYRRAIELIQTCSTSDGFIASPVKRHNYKRVWARDGVIIGLAALLDGNQDLVDTFKQTLLTLAAHQGPHGEIPSNVDTGADRQIVHLLERFAELFEFDFVLPARTSDQASNIHPDNVPAFVIEHPHQIRATGDAAGLQFSTAARFQVPVFFAAQDQSDGRFFPILKKCLGGSRLRFRRGCRAGCRGRLCGDCRFASDVEHDTE